MEISNNTVLITGGTSGIGYTMAEAFLNAGNTVIICGRRQNRLLEAQKAHPEFHIRSCDVASEKDRQSLADWAAARFPDLNILINNAGIQRDIDFSNGITEYHTGESEIAVNLEAPIVLSGMFIPHLAGKENAAIINVSSGLGFVPAARMPVYSATKAGLHAFSMALRFQTAHLGIHVFEVVPPAVDTELNPAGRAKRGGFKVDLQPPEFVAAVMKGLENDVFEMGYGMSEGLIKASRTDLDQAFQRMNNR